MKYLFNKQTPFLQVLLSLLGCVFFAGLTSCIQTPVIPKKSPNISGVVVSSIDPKNYDFTKNSFSKNSFSKKNELIEWWHIFESDDLGKVVSLALKNNLSIKKIQKNLDQARISVKRVNGEQYPTLSFSFDSSIQRGVAESENSSVSLASSYEVDLWGSRKLDKQGAQNDSLIANLDFQTAQISLSAEVVSLCLNISYLQKSKELMLAKQKLLEDKLSVLEKRYLNGEADVVDTLNTKRLIISNKEKISELDYSLTEASRALALLIGVTELDISEYNFFNLDHLHDFEIDSHWAKAISKRPDIISAWHSVISANIDVEKAELDRYPSLSLSALINSSEEKISDLLDDWLYKLALSLAVPIIDGNRLKLNVEQNKIAAETALISYREAVLNAVVDHKNGILNRDYQIKKSHMIDERLKLLIKQYQYVNTRYQNGNATYDSVLSLEQSINELELAVIENKKNILLSVITMARVTGGNLKGEKDKINE